MRKRTARLAIGLAFAFLLCGGGPGFRSQAQLDEHYAKHGAEFGNVSKAEYLRLAQDLRDAPAGGPILEAKRPDGQFSRFDRRKGSFGAYNPDRTIRTFFIPNDGERYFRRQARRGVSGVSGTGSFAGSFGDSALNPQFPWMVSKKLGVECTVPETVPETL